jgi:hypothetical protein
MAVPLVALALAAAALALAERTVATFSIVAADPGAGEVGIAVASRFFAVGSVVPYGRAGVGAVATQASADTTFGPRGLELLARGALPEEIATVLLRGDASASRRQLGIVASDGRSTSYTGRDCGPWAGGRSGPSYAVQGNILTGKEVVEDMAPRCWPATPRAATRAAGSRPRSRSGRPRRATVAGTTAPSTFASTITRSRSRSWGACSTTPR